MVENDSVPPQPHPCLFRLSAQKLASHPLLMQQKWSRSPKDVLFAVVELDNSPGDEIFRSDSTHFCGLLLVGLPGHAGVLAGQRNLGLQTRRKTQKRDRDRA